MFTKLQIIIIALFVTIQGNVLFASESFCNNDTPGVIQDRFELLANGTARDNYTNLIWRRCSLGEEWDEASQQCLGRATGDTWRNILTEIKEFNQDQFDAGKDYDWRLPNIKELASLTSLQCYLYAIDSDVFPRLRSAYWSSTPFNMVYPDPVYDDSNNLIGFEDQNMIWVLSSLTGQENWAVWNQTNFYALLVRGDSNAN